MNKILFIIPCILLGCQDSRKDEYASSDAVAEAPPAVSYDDVDAAKLQIAYAPPAEKITVPQQIIKTADYRFQVERIDSSTAHIE